MRGIVKRLGENKYRLQYEEPRRHGQRRQRSKVVYGPKAEAERVLADLILAGQNKPREPVTIEVLMKRFLGAKKLTCSITTYQTYKSIIQKSVLPAIGKVLVSEITKADLLDIYQAKAENHSPKTVREIHVIMKSSLAKAVIWGMATKNVASLIDKDDLPMRTRTIVGFLSESELTQLLSLAKNFEPDLASQGYFTSGMGFYAILWFLAYTGCRRGEALALRWTDIDFKRGKAVISKSLEKFKLSFKSPKNGRSRVISLDAKTLDVLTQHQASQANRRSKNGHFRDQGLVFCRVDGSPIRPDTLTHSFRKLAERAKLKVRLHDLRHTHASLLGKAGVPLHVTSRRLGHSSIQITADTYSHIYDTQDQAAAEAFEKLVG